MTVVLNCLFLREKEPIRSESADEFLQAQVFCFLKLNNENVNDDQAIEVILSKNLSIAVDAHLRETG
jgi:hypothetical protein